MIKGMFHAESYDEKRKTYSISYISQPNQKLIETGGIKIVGRNPVTNVVEIEYANSDNRAVKTVWHRSQHDAGAYGSDLVSGIVGQSRAFSFPKSLYSTKDSIAAVVRNNKNALIVDFFAGSGTTLHSVNLLNAEDGGHRRCILVTNNEVSESEAQALRADGLSPGYLEWEKHGICRAVTWPRTAYTILGKREDGSPLEGEYYINQTVEREMDRTFYHLGFVENTSSLSTSEKKQIVSLLGKSKLPQSLVKADSKFIVSDKHTASVLFDYEYCDEWLNALEDQDHITEFYIVAREASAFKSAKERVVELLGTITVTDNLKRPMSKGFATNAEYFKLNFLDKNSVSLGQQFREILPLLWLKSGAIGERPELSGDSIPEMMILPQNGFAILVDETKFAAFAKKLDKEGEIGTVYFITNSEEAFREMTMQIKVKHTYQLYRDYIDNFVIGSRRDLI